MTRPFLRLADERERAPIDDDETAMTELKEHWAAARSEYSALLGIVSPINLRWLITNTHSFPRGGLVRGHFNGMADAARDIAARATALADHLQRAADIYDRRASR